MPPARSVSTAEHVLAALAGLGVDNAVIEIDGPEVPIMDGSAAPFVAAIDQVGMVTLPVPRRYIRILKPVRVAKGDCYGELRPHPQGFRIELEIDFDHPLIGRQALALDIEPETFRRELARARTFGFMRDVAKLWSAGYALGASFENTLVVNDDRLLNPEGLRFADEFVRHKALDAIGDLALAGAPLLGAYRSVRGGHKLNHAVLSALMADPSAWVLVEGPELSPRNPPEPRHEAPPPPSAAMPTWPPAWWRRPTARTYPEQPPYSRPNVRINGRSTFIFQIDRGAVGIARGALRIVMQSASNLIGTLPRGAAPLRAASALAVLRCPARRLRDSSAACSARRRLLPDEPPEKLYNEGVFLLEQAAGLQRRRQEIRRGRAPASVFGMGAQGADHGRLCAIRGEGVRRVRSRPRGAT